VLPHESNRSRKLLLKIGKTKESRQPKGLKQRILDLIYEKKKKKKTRVKTKIKVNCVCLIIGDTSIGRDLYLYRQQDIAL
jgi:hypothetical protein